ncbi:MAG: ferritin [Bacteroidales bacterium]
MNTQILTAINNQIQAELYSSNLYLAMSSWANAHGYKGISQWLKMQALEEHTHAMKFITFLEDRNEQPEILHIDKPESTWSGIKEVFDEVLAHEQKVTKLINTIYDLAIQEKDHASTSFLQWFIDEQVEEEATASEIIDEISLAGEKGAGIYMIDKELGQRQQSSTTSSTDA